MGILGAALLLEACSLTILPGTEATATLNPGQERTRDASGGFRQYHSQAIISSFPRSSDPQPSSLFPPLLDSKSLSLGHSCISAGLPMSVAPSVRAGRVRGMNRIRIDSHAGLVILNAAQRSEGSGARSRETSRSMARSFGYDSGRQTPAAYGSFLMGMSPGAPGRDLPFCADARPIGS